MKRINNILKVSTLALIISIVTMTSVCATTVHIWNTQVPNAQGYGYVDTAKKSSSSDYGIVNLTMMSEITNVTFSAKAVGHSWAKGKVVSQTDTDFKVAYDAVYGNPQEMQARYRNHVWNLNFARIAGDFDYK